MIAIPMTLEERRDSEKMKKLNYYIWTVVKSNGVKDKDMIRRVFLMSDESKPFVRHILIDNQYYVTVAPTNSYNIFAHSQESESGFYHYFDSKIESYYMQEVKSGIDMYAEAYEKDKK